MAAPGTRLYEVKLIGVLAAAAIDVAVALEAIVSGGVSLCCMCGTVGVDAATALDVSLETEPGTISIEAPGVLNVSLEVIPQ